MKHPIAAVSALFMYPAILCAGDFLEQNKQVDALGGLTTAPALHDAEGFSAEGTMKPVFYDGLPWKGKPTRVFAWLGVPEGKQGKVPGIVLVHGGGGTAFKEWVKRWNARGFAAISIAVEGQTDRKGEGDERWASHEWAGPARDGIYGDSDQALADQWMYHAVADTVLAHSLLRALPEVDAANIGVMGISWGGVITSTVMGIDTRFAFAIPTYGCGHLADAGNQYGRALGKNDLYKQVWDPMVRMGRVKIPVLWFSWPQDQHFPLDCQAACYAASNGPHMLSLIPGMGHGHGPGWIKPDSYAFAESIVAGGKPWCAQSEQSLEGSHAKATMASAKPPDSATLVSTTGTGITGSRKWLETPAKLVQQAGGWTAGADLPEGTTAYFFNFKSGELTASSDYREVRR